MPKKCLSEKIGLDEKKMTEIKLDEKKIDHANEIYFF